MVPHIVGFWIPSITVEVGTTAPGELCIEGSAGGEHSSEKVVDWDWWSRESLGWDPVSEGLSDCAGWRPRSGLGSTPGSLQRSTASVNLLFPFGSCCWERTQHPAPNTHPAPRTQHPSPHAPSTYRSAPYHRPPISPGPAELLRGRQRTACVPALCPDPRGQGPGEAQGHPSLPPRLVPVALTGGAAGLPGGGEVEEEAEEKNKKRPRRPRHAPSPEQKNISCARGCETGRRGGAARAPGGPGQPTPPPPAPLPPGTSFVPSLPPSPPDTEQGRICSEQYFLFLK